MMGRPRLLVRLAVLAMLALFPATVAVAEEEIDPTVDHRLTASGYGMAQLGGWGSVYIHALGASVIWLVNADNLEITGDGEREDMDGGVVRLIGWEGEIHVSGERFGVRMVGGQLDFSATGRGHATLQGYGSFQADDREGRWTWRGVHIPRRAPGAAIRDQLWELRRRAGPAWEAPAPQ